MIIPDIPMPIKTDRLTIRPLQKNDAKIIHQYKKDSWNEFLPWLIWTQKPLDQLMLQDDILFCEKKERLFKERKDITVLAFDNARMLVGNGGLHHCDWENNVFTLGFAVRSSETGKGIATELGCGLVRYAFEKLQAKEIYAMHTDGNTGSQKVLQKLGFKRSRTDINAHKLLNKTVDEHHYKLQLNTDLESLC